MSIEFSNILRSFGMGIFDIFEYGNFLGVSGNIYLD